MITVALALALFLFDNQNPNDQWFWFYSLLLPCSGWLVLFGLRLNYYQQSMAANHGWEKATEQTIFEWQEWSLKQLPLLAQVLLTPDQGGISSLLGDAKDKPLFPQKVRPLASVGNSPKDLELLNEHFLIEINKQLTQGCPNYRRQLTHIYISTRLSEDLEFVKQVYQCWNIYPEKMDSYPELIQTLFINPPAHPILILSSQCWPIQKKTDYSELMTAQLIGSADFITAYKAPIIGWMGRIMPSTPARLKPDIE